MKSVYFFCVLFIAISLYSCKENIYSSENKTERDTVSISKHNAPDFFKNLSNDIYNAQNDNNRLGEIYFEAGIYFFDQNKNDSAYLNFNRSKSFFTIENDSLNISKNLLNIAIIQANENDFFGSEETATEGLKYAKDSVYIASLYNCLAISKTEQKDFIQSLEYYNKSLLFSNNNTSKIIIKSNQALVNIKMKEYLRSVETLSALLKDSAYLVDYPKIILTIRDNYAYAQWLNNPSYKADDELYKILHIREINSDLQGQIANHFHLSEYFTQKSPEKVIFHAEKMYEIAKQLKAPDDQIEAIKKLILLEFPNKSKKYLSEFLHLNDSLQTARNYAKNQFALIHYEVEKNKEENLLLKAENIKKDYQILIRNIIVISVLVISLLIIITFWFWYKKNKEQSKQKVKDKIHLRELTISKLIHDKLASGIYALASRIKNKTFINLDIIAKELYELYYKSRDISYEIELESELENKFEQTLNEIFTSYHSENIEINVKYLSDNIPWEKVSLEKKTEVYYVLMELMINMDKHSGATLVELTFYTDNNLIFIDYFDNGIGFQSRQNKNKGLENVDFRIHAIDGSINLESEKGKGLFIKIHFPI